MEKLIAAAQEGRFENIVQQAPVGITIFKGKDMIVEMANETYLQIIDKKADEFIGRSVYDSLPEIRSLTEPLLNKVYETGIPCHGLEFPIVLNRYGQHDRTYFNFVYQALKDDAGNITGIFVVANDVTNMVKARQALEESERQFRNMVMQSPIAMTIFRGPEYIIDIANQALLDNIWRKKAEEVIGRKALEVFPELKEQKYAALLEKVFTSGDPYREKDAFAIVGEERFYLDFEYRPLKDMEGKVTGILITVYDVTEKVLIRQHVEEAVRERTRELAIKAEALEKMNAELKSFAYVSSHDLQEPLRKIRIFAERITETELDKLSDTGKDYFKRIEKSASIMQTLINDLLAYSRTSNAERVMEHVSMNKLMEEAKEQFHEEIQEKKAIIRSDDLGNGYIIPFQFKQLLINLISNALKFSKADQAPVITLQYRQVKGASIPNSIASAQQDYHHFIFSDNGIGFDNQYKEKIFEIFQRLHSKEKFNGTGIGLAIVKKIVSNHNGFIEASGERDKGATFDIWIPVVDTVQ
jgi:PAS domain S-box-containing protein